MKDKKESKGIGWNLDNSYLNLPKVFFSKINLNPVSSPQLIILNDTLAKELGLDSNYLKTEECVKILSGSETIQDGALLHKPMQGINLGILRCSEMEELY